MEKKVRKGTSPLEEDYKDTEYNALRRRMSRLRVQQGQLPIADGECKGLVTIWGVFDPELKYGVLNTVFDNYLKKKIGTTSNYKTLTIVTTDIQISATSNKPLSKYNTKVV